MKDMLQSEGALALSMALGAGVGIAVGYAACLLMHVFSMPKGGDKPKISLPVIGCASVLGALWGAFMFYALSLTLTAGTEVVKKAAEGDFAIGKNELMLGAGALALYMGGGLRIFRTVKDIALGTSDSVQAKPTQAKPAN